MAKQDIRVKDGHRWAANPYDTKAGNTALAAGEWAIQGTGGDTEYAKRAANGSSNADVHIGCCVSKDTVTASVDGRVYIVDSPNAEFVMKPTTPANLAKAIIHSKVTMDLISEVFTLDEDDTTDGCFLITGFNVERGEIYFKVDPSYHLFG